MNAQEAKDIVKEKYGQTAVNPNENDVCTAGCCNTCPSELGEIVNISDSYNEIKGYEPSADLGLGCGIPTELAGIKEGDTVVDLGSGAGNDVFIARSLVGDKGKVIGLDMTKEMFNKANENRAKMGYYNVDFVLGDIEDMPIEDNSTDVIISNCVLNLVPDKVKAYSEVHRILKPKGHFSISDVVVKGEMTEGLKKSAELYAGCVSGAIEQENYLDIIKKAGFKNVEVKESKQIQLPEELLEQFLSEEDRSHIQNGNVGIFSITVVGYK